MNAARTIAHRLGAIPAPCRHPRTVLAGYIDTLRFFLKLSGSSAGGRIKGSGDSGSRTSEESADAMLRRDSAGLEHERNTPVPGSASGAATASGGRKAHRAQTAPYLDGLAPRSKSGRPPPQTRLRPDIRRLRCLFPSNPSDEVDRGARKARLVPCGSVSGIGGSAPLRKHATPSDLLRATTATRTRRRFRRMTNLCRE